MCMKNLPNEMTEQEAVQKILDAEKDVSLEGDLETLTKLFKD